MTAPYIPFYVGDYLADTTHLTRSEHGAYLLLLMAMWRGGGKLAADDDRLARLAHCSDAEWAGMRSTILSFFRCRGGVLRQKRLTAEYAKYTDTIAKRSAAGKRNARKRYNKDKEEAVGNGMPDGSQGHGNQNQNQNQNPSQSQLSSGSSPRGWPTLRTEWVDELIRETGCADPARDIWPRTTSPVVMAWHDLDAFEWCDVVAGIRSVLADSHATGAPRTWRYFAPAIARARQMRTQPTPEHYRAEPYRAEPIHAPNTKAAYRSRAERSRAERNEDSTIAAFSRAFGGPAPGEAEFEGSA
jgi:uncharacterized protein YdaU (DUF1376 family)